MPDSGHEETYKKFPVIYEKMIREFLEDLRNGFPKPEDEKPAKEKETKSPQSN
jgi:hypothetical protein